MKKLAVLAVFAALAACSDNDAAAPDAAATEAAAPAPAETSAAAPATAGTYEYTYEGKATTSVIKDDGTYEDTQDGKVVESGTWAVKDGKTCFDDSGANPEVCWTTTTPDAEGMFTATSDDGETVLTIKKTA